MAVSEKLLEILVCPEDKSSVRVASDACVEKLNKLIGDGNIKNEAGKAVADAIQGGLVREDNRFLYPIRNDIPVMLVDERIELDDDLQSSL